MEYQVKRSKRHTVAIEVSARGIIIRAPYNMSEKEIDSFFLKYEDWAKAKLEKQSVLLEKEKLIQANEKEFRRLARSVIPVLVEKYSAIMGLAPTAVKITSAKTRFGSCNSKKHLCFSWRLMAYPRDAIEYVVVHELAHLKYLNHSKNFYNLVEKFMPDYKERQKLLRLK